MNVNGKNNRDYMYIGSEKKIVGGKIYDI